MSSLLISVDQLAARLQDPDLRIFDVRHDLNDHGLGRRAFAAGHIPHARFLDTEVELSAPKTGKNGRHPLPERDAFAGLMAAHGVTPASSVVVYDASGGAFAAHVWWMLRWIGVDRVSVLDGGWPAWAAAGLPQTQGEAQALAPIAAKAAPSLVGAVDAQGVLANLQAPTFTVVDARAAARYRGEMEPIDPVAGHIPGALNRPNTDNVGADGRFKSAESLRAEFTAVIGERAPDEIVHQCGSGITACHNLFAMELAGLSGSRLYPGSWSEWCSDPSRPVARG